MESRPYNPRPKPRPHHSRPRPRPDHSSPRPPLPRPRPFKSETKTETETQYFSTRKTWFFHWEYFSTWKTAYFFTGDMGIYRRLRALFMPLLSFVSSFRSCDLDRVVLTETETFEPQDRDRDRDLWETNRDETETHKIRSRDLHHWCILYLHTVWPGHTYPKH